MYTSSLQVLHYLASKTYDDEYEILWKAIRYPPLYRPTCIRVPPRLCVHGPIQPVGAILFDIWSDA